MPGMFAMTMAVRPRDHHDASPPTRPRASPTASAPCRWPPSAVSLGRGAADMLQHRARPGRPGRLRAGGRLALAPRRRRAHWPRSGCCCCCASRCSGSASTSACSSAAPRRSSAVQILVWPVGFLSNAFVAPATMPGWLGAIAAWNPLSATVAAARELFGNPGWAEGTWPAQHALAAGPGLAAADHRGVPAAVGAPLPAAGPMNAPVTASPWRHGSSPGPG